MKGLRRVAYGVIELMVWEVFRAGSTSHGTSYHSGGEDRWLRSLRWVRVGRLSDVESKEFGESD